jgi:fatty-acyl-CoA synthase
MEADVPTLVHALLRARECERVGLTFLDHSLAATDLRWNEVAHAAFSRAYDLRELGVEAGDVVGIIVDDNRSFVLAFYACVALGALPIPIPAALATLDPQSYDEHVARILTTGGAKWLIARDASHSIAQSLAARGHTLCGTFSFERFEHTSANEYVRETAVADTDAAYLQFTSGSTSSPKGVVVSHANLLANITASHQRLNSVADADVGLLWMPLYHDFGLISAALTPLVSLGRSVIIPTMTFAMRPRVWMDAIHSYRATLTGSNTFGLRVATKRASASRNLDLSCLRVVSVGAEPVVPQVVRDFQAAFSHAGLRANAVRPCYGLAEATLAVTMPGDGDPIAVRRPKAARHDSRNETEFIACGRPMDEHDVRIADEQFAFVPEGVVGQILVRGPSVTKGYFSDQAATDALFHDGWLITGDLGFIVDGALHVTGRLKDLIIIRGTNYEPQQIEWEAAQVAGILPDCVAAFSVAGDDGERVIIAAEAQNPNRLAGVADAVRTRVLGRIGVKVHDVVLLEARSLPKTSSGKLRRAETRQRYLTGTLRRVDRGPRDEAQSTVPTRME